MDLCPPLAPMLARLARELPTGPGLLYEPKWDGFRSLVFRTRAGGVDMRSRHDRPFSRYFPELVEAFGALGGPGAEFVIDGEIVVLAPPGAGSALDFPALLARLHPAPSRVARLARETGAQIVALGPPKSAGADWSPHRRTTDGEVIEGTEWGLEVLHTPGHASDHVCFLLEEERVLFTGDLVLSGTTSVIAPPDGDMAAYLASLERIRTRRLSRICPGHGDVFDDPKGVLTEYIAHRLEREAQLLDALREGPSRIPDLVTRIYAELPEALHEAAARSVHAHLLKLKSEGKVSGRDVNSAWKVA